MTGQEELSGDLTVLMARLTVQDQTRRSKKMSFPSKELVLEFEILCCTLLGREYNPNGSHRDRQRRIVEAFGVPPVAQAKLWELLNEHYELEGAVKKIHILWGLNFMKMFTVISGHTSVMRGKGKPSDEKTFRNWTWYIVFALRDLMDVVVVWENRLLVDTDDDCVSGVDTVDAPFPQVKIPHPTKPGVWIRNKALFSFKLNGPGLRYEVGLALKTDDVVSVRGPFLPGNMNDVMIFQEGLLHMLDEGERVEADDIYNSLAPTYVKCPKSIESRFEEEAFRKRVGGRQETINARFKYFECLNRKFKGNVKNKVEKHQALFFAVATVTQVALEMGCGQLFEIDY